MLLQICSRAAANALRADFRRAISINVPALQTPSDPIQSLFLDKVREYKSKSPSGKLVDATPEIERELKNELERVAKQYGGQEGGDMTKFPEFKFAEPKVDPISQTNQ